MSVAKSDANSAIQEDGLGLRIGTPAHSTRRDSGQSSLSHGSEPSVHRQEDEKVSPFPSMVVSRRSAHTRSQQQMTPCCSG